ncbi:MAG: ATP synthase F1 subunit gamma [Anaerolineae bacterium]
MPSSREIRRRIRSVKNIKQITKAMETVSASKMRRAQQQTLASRPYAQKAQEVLGSLARQSRGGSSLHPLLQQRDQRNIILILVTADRGLAGSFNSNMLREALRWMREQPGTVNVITVGKKGRDFVRRIGRPILAEFTPLPEPPTLGFALPIARIALDEFLKGNADAVYIAYTDFVSALRQKPEVRRLLPLEPVWAGQKPAMVDYIYEPSPEAILDVVLPRFTELQVYQAILESVASEHSSRMVAMRNANEAAGELIQDLTLTYNKARQEGITREILDIAGGSAALEQAR